MQCTCSAGGRHSSAGCHGPSADGGGGAPQRCSSSGPPCCRGSGSEWCAKAAAHQSQAAGAPGGPTRPRGTARASAAASRGRHATRQQCSSSAANSSVCCTSGQPPADALPCCGPATGRQHWISCACGTGRPDFRSARQCAISFRRYSSSQLASGRERLAGGREQPDPKAAGGPAPGRHPCLGAAAARQRAAGATGEHRGGGGPCGGIRGGLLCGGQDCRLPAAGCASSGGSSAAAAAATGSAAAAAATAPAQASRARHLDPAAPVAGIAAAAAAHQSGRALTIVAVGSMPACWNSIMLHDKLVIDEIYTSRCSLSSYLIARCGIRTTLYHKRARTLSCLSSSFGCLTSYGFRTQS